MKSYFSILFLLFPILAAAQVQTLSQPQSQSRPAAPPDTEIFVASLKIDGNKVTVGTPSNVTNHKGYDNQPRFLPKGNSFYYTSIKEDGQADTYLYDLQAGISTRMTNTKESEFSPTLMPDGQNFSVIRVEPDGTQRLWKFPATGGEPSLVLENVKRVGYHAWVDAKTVVVFILGEPVTLQAADVATGKTELIAEKVGRCLQNIPGTDRISFTRSTGDKTWNIEEWDPKTRKTKVLTTATAEEADYAWLPNGSLLMANDSKLLLWTPGKQGWEQVADFTADHIHGITRMAVNPGGDKLALVAAE